MEKNIDLHTHTRKTMVSINLLRIVLIKIRMQIRYEDPDLHHNITYESITLIVATIVEMEIFFLIRCGSWLLINCADGSAFLITKMFRIRFRIRNTRVSMRRRMLCSCAACMSTYLDFSVLNVKV